MLAGARQHGLGVPVAVGNWKLRLSAPSQARPACLNHSSIKPMLASTAFIPARA